MIRVLIAEDHPVVRTGLEQLLRATEDMEIAGVAEDGEQAVALAAESKPDVVLMDLVMPSLDGVAATQKIVAANPDARVVVLTSFADRKRILAALDGGAVGYLLKDADPGELLRGIRSAAQGRLAAGPAGRLGAARRPPASRRSAEEQLTERELDVLALVGDGLPNKLIARRLEISEKTVKAHLTRVFSVLGVTDRTQAALWAQRNDIISREP